MIPESHPWSYSHTFTCSVAVPSWNPQRSTSHRETRIVYWSCLWAAMTSLALMPVRSMNGNWILRRRKLNSSLTFLMKENNATNPRRSLLHQKVVLHVPSLIDRLWMLYLDPNLRTLIIKNLVSPFGYLPSSLPTRPAREISPSLKPSAGTGTLLQLTGPIPVTRDSTVGTRSPKVLSPLAPLTRKVGEAEAARAANRKEQLPVGGKLVHFQDSWTKLFPQHPEIVRKVSQGILIAFDDVLPSLLRYPLELPSNNKTADLHHAVQKLQLSRAIEEVMDTMSPGYYSRLFLVPKPDGSFRPIIGLKKLNQFIIVPSFKMETLFSIIAALQPQEWITKIDLKDAYHHIRKNFRFVVAGIVYQFRVLPFGLSTAPREFTKTLAPVVQLLCSRGIQVHAYLDDWIIRASSQQQSLEHTQHVIQLLQSLGWTINWDKSMLQPSRILDFLGLHFNVERALISPPDSFLPTLTNVLSRLSRSTVMPARKVSSIISRMSHFAPFISSGCLHLQFLQFWFKAQWSQHQQSWDTPIQLDTDFLTYLRWFQWPTVMTGVPLHLPEPTLFFFTDASLKGWGASWKDNQIYGLWSAPEFLRHINWLELEAIRLALLQWGPQWRHHSVRVYCDNSTAVAYICKQGGTHSQSLFYKTLELFDLLDQFVITLIPTHLPGARNVTADVLSRIRCVLARFPTTWVMSDIRESQFHRINAAPNC